MSSIPITPFHLAIPDTTLDELRHRLAQTRFGEALPGNGWEAGMESQVLRRLVEHWCSFDWRTAEAAINAVPAFRTEIDGLGIHFVHVRGHGERRLPLLLGNGWPSCFTELLSLVPLLTKEVDGWSFDVVIPSLPGYGLSDRPAAPGINISKIADMWAELMTRLGYMHFLAHGSDMSAGVVERLRANHAEHLLGIHMVNVNWFYPRPDDLTPAEQIYLDRAQQWQASEGAYAALHASKPQTIATALNDSPAGLAAWIGEKFHAWSDNAISLDALCTVLTLYWATETIGSSQWLYREAFADAGVMSPPPKHGVPVAVAVFPHDIAPAPRTWGERWYDIARWSVMSRGGHFPGFETPELLVDDLRGFVNDLEKHNGS